MEINNSASEALATSMVNVMKSEITCPIGHVIHTIDYETGEVFASLIQHKEGFPGHPVLSSLLNAMKHLQLPAQPEVAVALDECLVWEYGTVLSSNLRRSKGLIDGEFVEMYETLEARVYLTVDYREEISKYGSYVRVIVEIAVKHPSYPVWRHKEYFYPPV